jgi:hypothetical protein
LYVFDPKNGNNGLGDALGRPAISHQFAQHGPKANDEDQVAQGAADPDLDRFANGGHGHPGDQPQPQSHQDKRNEGIQLDDGDQQDQRKDSTNGKNDRHGNIGLGIASR